MREQIISFSLMIFFTLLAFIAVKTDGINNPIHFPLFVLLLAVIQIIFQLYYFMHAKEKGHKEPLFFLYCGVFVSLTIILALTTLI